MTRIATITNTTGITGTWAGIEIATGASYTLEAGDFDRFAQKQSIFNAIANGTLVVSDGVTTLSAFDGWQWLVGNRQEVSITQTSEVADKKLWTHNSAKPEVEGKHFFSQWVGFGDDMTTGAIGGGNQCIVQNTVGVPTKSIDIHLYNIGTDIYLHEGYAMWAGCSIGDTFSATVMSSPTQLQTAANLDYELDTNNRVMAAASGAGTGTHGFAATPILVPCYAAVQEGYWNYDEVAGLTYAPAADGKYDIFSVEVAVNRFIESIPLLGTSSTYTQFDSDDVSKLPPGYFLRIETNNASNTTWDLAFMMTVFRQKTVNTVHDGV